MHAMKGLVWILAVLTVGCVTGCYTGDERSIDRTMRPDELAGEWRMTPQTVDDLRAVGYSADLDPAQHKVIVQPNGECHFHTFISPMSSTGSANAIVDSSCRWALREANDSHTLVIEFPGEPATVTMYAVGEKDGRLLLWQPAGDPDAGRYVEYVRGN